MQRALSGRLEIPLTAGSYEYGDAFEHFIILEFRRLMIYFKQHPHLNYPEKIIGLSPNDILVWQNFYNNKFTDIAIILYSELFNFQNDKFTRAFKSFFLFTL